MVNWLPRPTWRIRSKSLIRLRQAWNSWIEREENCHSKTEPRCADSLKAFIHRF